MIRTLTLVSVLALARRPRDGLLRRGGAARAADRAAARRVSTPSSSGRSRLYVDARTRLARRTTQEVRAALDRVRPAAAGPLPPAAPAHQDEFKALAERANAQIRDVARRTRRQAAKPREGAPTRRGSRGTLRGRPYTPRGPGGAARRGRPGPTPWR